MADSNEFTLKVYDVLNQLLNAERIQNNLLKQKIKTLEEHKVKVPQELIDSIQMVADVCTMGCDQFAAKYGNSASTEWPRIIQREFSKFLESL